jgi:hypothetical protein
MYLSLYRRGEAPILCAVMVEHNVPKTVNLRGEDVRAFETGETKNNAAQFDMYGGNM